MLFQVPLYGNAFCCYHHPHPHHHHRYLHHYFHHYHQHVITTTTIIITVIFFVIIIIAVIETFPLFLPAKKRGVSRRRLQEKAKRGKGVWKLLYPPIPPSLPPILSCIMIANTAFIFLSTPQRISMIKRLVFRYLLRSLGLNNSEYSHDILIQSQSSASQSPPVV